MTFLTASKVKHYFGGLSKVKHYFGGLCAVSDFNLDLRSGELMGVIGPNGAGKTTIFNLITGVYQASEGSIQFKGTELVGKTPHQITALRIGRTFQNIRLFRDLSVLDNVRIAHYAQADYSPLEALLQIGRYRREEQRMAATGGRSSASSRIPSGCWRFSIWKRWPEKPPRTCLTACNGDWRSRGRSPLAPNCCCWTNRRRV